MMILRQPVAARRETGAQDWLLQFMPHRTAPLFIEAERLPTAPARIADTAPMVEIRA